MVARSLHPLDPPSLGAWSLTTRIGTGSGTVVYRAVDAAGRPGAVKSSRPHGDDPTVLGRLWREAQVLSGLAVPGIARLLDDGTDADVPYIAIELVDGPSLRTVVDRRGARAGIEGVAIATAVLRTLVRLHAAGVVHADLKPTNVLCGRGGPVIIDFDAACRARAGAGAGAGAAPPDADATVEGTFRASPAWLAPEQALGEPASPATDVFSWAALTTFCLTGRSPFGEGSAPALLYRIVHEAPDLGALPRPLAALLDAVLRKEPRERPSAAEAMQALRGMVGGARRGGAEASRLAA